MPSLVKRKRARVETVVKGLPSVEQTAANGRERLEQMCRLAGEVGSWKPASEAIVETEAVRTCMPHLDYRLGVGGFPLRHIGLVTGPSHEGKTFFVLLLLASFVREGHYAAFIDAERAVTRQFSRFVMGDAYESPLFRVLPTSSYEKVRAGVRMFCDEVVDARARGRIPKDATGIFVVDSIKKLIPDKLWEKLSKDLEKVGEPKRDRFGKEVKDGGVDGMKGMAGMIKAQFNAAWLDELVPLLNESNTTMVIIGREHVRKEKGSAGFENEVIEVGGGDALKFDPSLRFRVFEEPRWLGPKGERKFVGGRHVVEVHKTRFGARPEQVPTCVFHSSNGNLFAPGHDRAADVLALARELGEVTGESWLDAHVGDGEMVKLGQGELQSLKRLMAEPDLVRRIEAVCRARF